MRNRIVRAFVTERTSKICVLTTIPPVACGLGHVGQGSCRDVSGVRCCCARAVATTQSVPPHPFIRPILSCHLLCVSSSNPFLCRPREPHQREGREPARALGRPRRAQLPDARLQVWRTRSLRVLRTIRTPAIGFLSATVSFARGDCKYHTTADHLLCIHVNLGTVIAVPRAARTMGATTATGRAPARCATSPAASRRVSRWCARAQSHLGYRAIWLRGGECV